MNKITRQPNLVRALNTLNLYSDDSRRASTWNYFTFWYFFSSSSSFSLLRFFLFLHVNPKRHTFIFYFFKRNGKSSFYSFLFLSRSLQHLQLFFSICTKIHFREFSFFLFLLNQYIQCDVGWAYVYSTLLRFG